MKPAATYRTWRRNRGKRLPAACYPPNHPVHVVICAVGCQPFFERPELADCVIALVDAQLATLAACLMPDHLHWLLSSSEPFSRIVQRFKSYSTNRCWRIGHQGRLWQRSFYDHVLRKRESVRRTAEYIVHNPVRAGLVEDWRAYPYTRLYPERM